MLCCISLAAHAAGDFVILHCTRVAAALAKRAAIPAQAATHIAAATTQTDSVRHRFFQPNRLDSSADRLGPATMATTASDVLIIGGGLAGLTLAIQLRRELPALSVRVLERHRHPVPEAAFKIGESTVEIGAHYLDTVLDLQAHLDTRQLRKFGFRFFFSDGREDIDQTTELGVSQVFPTPSYQIDRGIFENFLAEHATALGVDFIDGASVRSVDLAAGAGLHALRYEQAGIEQVAHARWLIDASGRAGLLKHKLDLAQTNTHDANAIWFRIDERLKIDDWCATREWMSRCSPRERWRSTNHLCGPGYWAWLIPLASGSHSIGLVADATLHPLESINSFDKAMDWFATHQPRLYRELDSRRHRLQDFAFLRHYSHSCKQVFSAQRWAITGVAGVFLDPFYSPGTDFIAIGNTYIVELIARETRGENIARAVRQFEQLYFSFYRNTLAMFEGQYPMFGHAQLMPIKVVWDYAYYWGVLCQLFFQRRLTDFALFARLGGPLAECEALNRDIQTLLRRAAGTATGVTACEMIDQSRLPWFGELNRGLRDRLGDQALQQRIEDNAHMLRALAAEIVQRVAAINPLANTALPALIGLRDTPASTLLRAAA
jgi:flavin-dependent dehydrogenase